MSLKLFRTGARVLRDLPLGSTIVLKPVALRDGSPICHWRVSRQMKYLGRPYIELTNLDSGAVKAVSLEGLHACYEFSIVTDPAAGAAS